MGKADAFSHLVLLSRTAEKLENPFMILFSDAAAIILYFQANEVPSIRDRPYRKDDRAIG